MTLFRRLVGLFVSMCFIASLAAPAVAQNKSWIGENVLPTKTAKDIKFGDRIDGKQVNYPFSGRWPFKVRDDKDGFLRLHDGRNEGWVDKNEFVLAKDSFAYFNTRVQNNPKDGFALAMRGAFWLDKKEADKAIEDFDACIALNRNDAGAFNNRGLARAEKKQFDKAIADYGEALRVNPKNTVTYANRGVAWRNLQEWDKAIEDYNEAVRLEPRYANAWYGRGIAWAAKKDHDKAIEDFDETLRIDPKHVNGYNSRGLSWAAKKLYEKALADYTEALSISPKNAAAYANRAASWKATKRFENAIRDYEETIRLDPKFTRGYTNLSWILATCPEDKLRNGKKAVELATKANQLTDWKDGGALDVLAAAYAEAGEFDKAVRYETQALDVPRFEKQSGVQARARLKLYEQKKPFRE